jgi:tetratricopeptide (TPR) repeat protein
VLRRIARRFLKSRDFDEAGEVYEEILKLDSKDEEARKRTAEIQAGVIERMMERRRALVRNGVIAAVVLPALAFVVREFASRPAESRERLRAARAAVEAAHAFGQGRLLLEQKRHEKAVESLETAAVGFRKAAGVIESFREEWGWTLASRAAAKDIAEWRLQSAKARLEIALAHENTGDFDEAYRVYARLDHQPGVPLEVARKAEESLERLRPLVKDAAGVLP